MQTDPWSLSNIASHFHGTGGIAPTTSNPTPSEMPKLCPTNHDTPWVSLYPPGIIDNLPSRIQHRN